MEKNWNSHCQLPQNFFDRDIKGPDGRPIRFHRYEQIMKEQVMISYVSKSITIEDTDNMCPFDREMIYKNLEEIKSTEKEMMDDLLNK